jgi:hypothetical protein
MNGIVSINYFKIRCLKGTDDSADQICWKNFLPRRATERLWRGTTVNKIVSTVHFHSLNSFIFASTTKKTGL